MLSIVHVQAPSVRYSKETPGRLFRITTSLGYSGHEMAEMITSWLCHGKKRLTKAKWKSLTRTLFPLRP